MPGFQSTMNAQTAEKQSPLFLQVLPINLHMYIAPLNEDRGVRFKILPNLLRRLCNQFMSGTCLFAVLSQLPYQLPKETS